MIENRHDWQVDWHHEIKWRRGIANENMMRMVVIVFFAEAIAP